MSLAPVSFSHSLSICWITNKLRQMAASNASAAAAAGVPCSIEIRVNLFTRREI